MKSRTPGAARATPRASALQQMPWFTWTPYADCGPGADVLGSPSTALELGSGIGDNAAHLVHRGVDVTVVEPDGRRLARVEDQWGYLRALRPVQREAVDFLRLKGPRYSAVYSVFGAAWTTDPRVLLPLVRARLTPGGVYVFSQEAPIEGCYGCQGFYARGRDGRPVPVRRWAYTPAMWHDLLRGHGFQRVVAGIIPAPEPRDVPTLIVRARP